MSGSYWRGEGTGRWTVLDRRQTYQKAEVREEVPQRFLLEVLYKVASLVSAYARHLYPLIAGCKKLSAVSEEVLEDSTFAAQR
jgi:hypothetical protein